MPLAATILSKSWPAARSARWARLQAWGGGPPSSMWQTSSVSRPPVGLSGAGTLSSPPRAMRTAFYGRFDGSRDGFGPACVDKLPRGVSTPDARQFVPLSGGQVAAPPGWGHRAATSPPPTTPRARPRGCATADATAPISCGPMLSRERAIEALAGERFDVVVIGGGITGAGVALDAASRGYSVALVEKADFASGTSSRSSKLVHGGLRYLQNFDLGLVREALLERRLMVKLAPHLVKPLPFVVPAFDGARPDRLIGIGLNMYDVMATPIRGRRGSRRAGRATSDEEADTEWSPERHRVIDGEEVVGLLPALAPRDPTGGYLFYDCQTDDSRLVLTVLGEAERFGAICANRLEVVELEHDNGGGTGVKVRDGEGGVEFTVHADNVVSATGVWADRIRPEELHSEAEVPTIAPSRGTHITLADVDLPLRAGAIVPAGEGRSIFALPWLGRALIGTTDNNYEGEIDHVQPSGGGHRVPARRVKRVLRDGARGR